MPLPDALAVIGIVISVIALMLSVYVYHWSKKDLKEFIETTAKSIDRWSDVTIRIEAATTRIEKHLDKFTDKTFDLLADQMRGADRVGAEAAARQAERTDKLVGEIQQQSRDQIKRVLEQQGVARDKAPEIGNKLSQVFAENLVKSRAAANRARDDTLREEVLQLVAEHAADGITFGEIEDLLGATYARSDIATAIDFLRSSGAIEFTPDELRPDALLKPRRSA